jgi:hypothetical protein
MKPTRLIAGLTRQAVAAWTVVLSLLLAWTVGTSTPQAGAGVSVRSGTISVVGAPELAAVQVKSGASTRATDERYGAGPEPLALVAGSVPVLAPQAVARRIVPPQTHATTRAHGPQNPRAPPAA